MRAMAVITGLVGLIALPSSPMFGLLALALAVGIWIADLARKAQMPPSQHPTQHSHPTTAPVVTSRPAGFRLALQPGEMQWLGPDRQIMVHGYLIRDALAYYSARPTVHEASCIDLSLPVGKPIAEPRGALGYWPQYARMSPGQRANYLQWLADGRKGPLDDIGYAFIYFYGLERRALVDDQDHELILEEAVRLLGRYRQSASFDGYLGGLIEYSSARRGLERVDDSWFQRFLARTASSVALAWLVVHDRPLPAELALAVARQDVRSPRSVVVNRLPEQFRELFERKYEERFGSGMKLRTAARPHRLEYRPGSPTLLYSMGLQARQAISIPNVLGIGGQFKPLVRIWTDCIEELRPLSRQAAKGMDLTTREAYWALPPELRAETDHPDKPRWEQVVAAQTPSGAFALVPVSSLAQLEGLEKRPRLTQKQSEQLAATACEVGFGIAPDCRAVSRAYRWDEYVALFRMEEPTPPRDAAFSCAACMMELGVALAAADGTVEDAEVLHIMGFLGNQFALSPDDALHLDGYRRALLKQPPRMSSLSKRLQDALTLVQRELIGRFLVGVAAASGSIHRKEITALRSAYRSLGVEPAKLDELLDEMRGPEEPVEVQTGAPTPAGEPIPRRAPLRPEPLVVLDMSRVHRLLVGTAEVQRILVGAMTAAEDLEELEPIAPSGRPASAASVTVIPALPPHLLAGLDEHYYPVLAELLKRDDWQPQDLDALARRYGFMRSGMLGVINDWAMEQFGELLVDDQQVPCTINRSTLGQLS